MCFWSCGSLFHVDCWEKVNLFNLKQLILYFIRKKNCYSRASIDEMRTRATGDSKMNLATNEQQLPR
jgi:hypothetical protein